MGRGGEGASELPQRRGFWRGNVDGWAETRELCLHLHENMKTYQFRRIKKMLGSCSLPFSLEKIRHKARKTCSPLDEERGWGWVLFFLRCFMCHEEGACIGVCECRSTKKHKIFMMGSTSHTPQHVWSRLFGKDSYEMLNGRCYSSFCGQSKAEAVVGCEWRGGGGLGRYLDLRPLRRRFRVMCIPALE